MILTFGCTNQSLIRTDNNKLAANSQKYVEAYFTLNWEGYSVWAVFEKDGEAYKVTLNNNKCLVAHEVLTEGWFTVSLRGTKHDGTIATSNKVEIEVTEGPSQNANNSTEPTLDVIDQIDAKVELVKNKVTNIEDKINNGEIGGSVTDEAIKEAVDDYLDKNPPEGIDGKDGFSPTVDVTAISNGHEVTVTDADGPKTFNVMNGADGKDGTSPEKGIDYFTEADKAEFVKEATELIAVPTKVSELENDKGYLTDYEETDPTVPEWAKHSTKPTYNASEVGADPEGTAASKVAEHNINTDAHNDLRLLITELTNRLNALADSDDTTLDQMSEIVAYIKSNKALIESVTTLKVNVTDIIDNLTTKDSNRPLSAAQGVMLKGLIDAISVPTKTSQLTNDSGFLTAHQDISGKADKSTVNAHTGNADIHVTAAKKAEWDAKSNFSGAYSDLSGKPTGLSAFINDEEYVKKNEVYDYTEVANFTNVFDTVGIEYGKMLSGTTGEVLDTASPLAVTDYIDVRGGGVTIRTKDFDLYKGGSAMVVLYRPDKSFVLSAQFTSFQNSTYYFSNLVQNESGNYVQFDVNRFPSTAGFIRICTNTSVIGNNPVLTIDEEIEYEMGYGTKLNNKVKVDYAQVINTPTQNCWSILPNEHINIAYSQVNASGKAVKPINTLEHFIHVAENYGYNTLKCDVRPTSDSELVLCHDAGFTFDGNGKITTYDSNNQTLIHNVTAATVLGYSHPTGEHPCLVGDYLDVCRKYGKIAFVTIRNEYMDVVIPKLIDELKKHNMTYATIINCMTYESLVTWRTLDKEIMINYTLSYGANMDSEAIDKAIGLGYCSLCGFGLSSSSTVPSTTCDFAYARANGIRLLQAIAYKEGTAEDCYTLGYDGCQIGYAWNPVDAVTTTEVNDMITSAIGNAIGGAY